jgi:hypothetical protein
MLKYVIWEYNYVIFLIKKFNFDNFNWGGLCEKHAVATWNFGFWEPSQQLLEERGKPVLRWLVTGPSRCILTFREESSTLKMKIVSHFPDVCHCFIYGVYSLTMTVT